VLLGAVHALSWYGGGSLGGKQIILTFLVLRELSGRYIYMCIYIHVIYIHTYIYDTHTHTHTHI